MTGQITQIRSPITDKKQTIIYFKNYSIVGDSQNNNAYTGTLDDIINTEKDVKIAYISFSANYDSLIHIKSGGDTIFVLGLWNGFSINEKPNLLMHKKKFSVEADSLETQTTRIDGIIILEEVN